MKYTARHEINDPARELPDPRVEVPSSSPDRRNFYYSINTRNFESLNLFMWFKYFNQKFGLRIYAPSDF